jgi:hypothetical protein
MNKFLAIIASFCLFACSQTPTDQATTNIWHFKAQNNNPQLDNNAEQIISGYKALLNDYANMDTLKIKEGSINLAKLTDSLALLKLTTDSSLQMNWTNGLNNISGELQGVYMSNAENNNKIPIASTPNISAPSAQSGLCITTPLAIVAITAACTSCGNTAPLLVGKGLLIPAAGAG